MSAENAILNSGIYPSNVTPFDAGCWVGDICYLFAIRAITKKASGIGGPAMLLSFLNLEKAFSVFEPQLPSGRTE